MEQVCLVEARHLGRVSGFYLANEARGWCRDRQVN